MANQQKYFFVVDTLQLLVCAFHTPPLYHLLMRYIVWHCVCMYYYHLFVQICFENLLKMLYMCVVFSWKLQTVFFSLLVSQWYTVSSQFFHNVFRVCQQSFQSIHRVNDWLFTRSRAFFFFLF